MGYVGRDLNRPWLVIDTETTAIVEIDDYADDLRVDSRLKDPEKIQAARTAALEKAALDIDLARIIATAVWLSDDPNPIIRTGKIDDEFRLLTTFWSAYEHVVIDRGGLLVGYNILGYDLPLIIRRSQLLAVREARHIELNKYRPGAIVDLQQLLSFQGAKPFRSLNFYAKRFALDVPCDAHDGADIARLVAAGEWDAIAHHVRTDVTKTRALAERLDVLRVSVPEEAVF